MYQTNMYEGMLAETTAITSTSGDVINAYFARPLGAGPFPGMVLIHHMPGWDEWYREATRKFAHHGYATLSPDLYHREDMVLRKTWQPKSVLRAASRMTK